MSVVRKGETHCQKSSKLHDGFLEQPTRCQKLSNTMLPDRVDC
jgi:hypothetical protein